MRGDGLAQIERTFDVDGVVVVPGAFGLVGEGEAEKLAETDEQKYRVAVARLPMWKLMLKRGMDTPQEAGRRFLDAA